MQSDSVGRILLLDRHEYRLRPRAPGVCRENPPIPSVMPGLGRTGSFPPRRRSCMSFSVQRSAAEPPSDILDLIRNGDRQARDRLLGWVYDDGLAYFLGASAREQLLSPDEAADLAGDCVLEFDRALPRVHNAVHYARRMYRNNLGRYLRRKRARLMREICQASVPERAVRPAETSGRRRQGVHRLDDEERRMWRAARRRIRKADPEMQQIIRFRLAAEPLSYRLIGEIMGASEPALRMKMTRFCRSVRREYARIEKRRSWRASDRLPARRRG